MRCIEERESRATIHFGAGAKSPNLSTARSARSPSPGRGALKRRSAVAADGSLSGDPGRPPALINGQTAA
ncbi:unnamed protein product [Arctogadus glacialis]